MSKMISFRMTDTNYTAFAAWTNARNLNVTDALNALVAQGVNPPSLAERNREMVSSPKPLASAATAGIMSPKRFGMSEADQAKVMQDLDRHFLDAAGISVGPVPTKPGDRLKRRGK